MNPETQSWIIQGDNAFNTGYYSNALGYYNQALQTDIKNPQILTKIGNTYYAMHMYTTSYNFYEEALTDTGAFTIIYEYAFGPNQPPDLYMLQKNLRDEYQMEIIIQGLDFIISNIQQEIQEKTPLPSINIKQAKRWENLAIKIFKQAGILFPREIFDVIHQIKHILPDTIPDKYSLILSKRMGWVQFEKFLQSFFEQKGYQVTRTKKSHDFGGDLILRKPGESIVVQAKKRKSTIGIKSVQETYSAKAYYQTKHALLITTSRFTKPAIELANRLGVELWDWQRLVYELKQYQQNQTK